MSQQTSWESSSAWYQKTVGDSGHYYHEHVVIPKSLTLLDLNSQSSLLDLACGQGVLERQIPPAVPYLGLDISPSLIDFAKSHTKNSLHHFQVADITRPFTTTPQHFSHAAIILALQNIDQADQVIQNLSSHLVPSGKLLLVLNHPAFRIPRQSSWGIDPQNKLEYRRINRYQSPLKIPITTNPGMANSTQTWSFHNPLSYYFKILKQAGFTVTDLEEWTSDKKSVGKNSRSENLARSEFPLFMALLAQKT